MSSIVATKLFVPRPRPSYVPREHLMRRVGRGLSGPVTLICAPAGFGKTTLASSALQGADMPVSWLSLDEQDGDLTRIIAGICAAIEKNMAGFGEATRALLDSPQGVLIGQSSFKTTVQFQKTTSTYLLTDVA